MVYRGVVVMCCRCDPDSHGEQSGASMTHRQVGGTCVLAGRSRLRLQLRFGLRLESELSLGLGLRLGPGLRPRLDPELRLGLGREPELKAGAGTRAGGLGLHRLHSWVCAWPGLPISAKL